MARRKLSKPVSRHVRERAGDRCEYCGYPSNFNPDPMEFEHILPVSRGGTDDLDNLALSCRGCNGKKGDSSLVVDPETGDSVPLFHPRRDRWTDHYAWSSDGIIMIDITRTGRATVKALDLNRPALQKIRFVIQKDIGR